MRYLNVTDSDTWNFFFFNTKQKFWTDNLKLHCIMTIIKIFLEIMQIVTSNFIYYGYCPKPTCIILSQDVWKHKPLIWPVNPAEGANDVRIILGTIITKSLQPLLEGPVVHGLVVHVGGIALILTLYKHIHTETHSTWLHGTHQGHSSRLHSEQAYALSDQLYMAWWYTFWA